MSTDALPEKPKIDLREIFTKESVEKYNSNPGKIAEDHIRHYHQLTTRFDDSSLRATLLKYKIPMDCRVTVFGGYTGQFAECLRRLGMHVVFTDPIPEWVDEASKKGFEALQLSVQEIPRELLARTDLFASFECYPDLIGEEAFLYPFMRFLTTPFGILFAESKETVNSMRREDDQNDVQELGSLRRHFRPLYRVYNIQRKFIKTELLNIYHIFAVEATKKILTIDCRVLKTCYDNFDQDCKISTKDAIVISERSTLDQQEVEESIKRISDLSKSIHSPFVKSMPSLAHLFEGAIYLGSKRLYFHPDLS